jgi:hypothetical protein
MPRPLPDLPILMPMRVLLASTSVGMISLALLVSTATGAATHAQYVAEVNPICKKAGEAIERIPKKITPSGDPAFDAYRGGLLFSKLLGKATRRIAAVEPPPEDAVAVRSWIDGLRQQKRLIDRSLRAARNGDLNKAAGIARRVSRLEKRNQKKALRLDLNACAGGTSA